MWGVGGIGGGQLTNSSLTFPPIKPDLFGANRQHPATPFSFLIIFFFCNVNPSYSNEALIFIQALMICSPQPQLDHPEHAWRENCELNALI